MMRLLKMICSPYSHQRQAVFQLIISTALFTDTGVIRLFLMTAYSKKAGHLMMRLLKMICSPYSHQRQAVFQLIISTALITERKYFD